MGSLAPSPMAPEDFRALALRRAARARKLAERFEASREALHFAAAVCQFQSEIAHQAQHWEELGRLRERVVKHIQKIGPLALREAAAELDSASFQTSLEKYWRKIETASPASLPARIVLQPFAFQQSPGSEAAPDQPSNRCPACGHVPQAGVLRPAGHGSALSLVCSLCLTEWPCTRGTCTACQKRGQGVLDFYSCEELPHIQVQACRFCRTYLQIVDLGKNPEAVPDIDELSALPLDVWAVDERYVKQQVNLVGI